jgi:hypothetical protein
MLFKHYGTLFAIDRRIGGVPRSTKHFNSSGASLMVFNRETRRGENYFSNRQFELTINHLIHPL